jgi:lysophospholipid acyltransferase 5
MLERGPSHVLSDYLRVPEPSARFLLALYGAYLFSFIYRYYVSRQRPLVQNLYWTLSGILVVAYVYGWGVWHMLVDVFAVYLTLRLLGGTRASLVVTWVITMGHLMAGYLHVKLSNEIHPIAWTIPHCVLVLKLIGLAFSLYDGQKKQEAITSEEVRKNAVPEVPSFFEVMGFSFFPGAVLAGPQMWFVRYRDFVEGKLFDFHATPSSSFAGTMRFLLGTTLSIIYAVLNKYYPFENLGHPSFAYNEILITKLWLVFVSGYVVLFRYIAVWLIAEGSCIVSGISYNGVGKDSKPDWSGLANIKLMDFLSCTTLQV